MSVIPGDPEELEYLARQLGAYAHRAREAADDQLRRASAARWVSDGADVYRGRLAETHRQVHTVADRIEHAAGILRTHAGDVRHRIAVLSRVGQDAVELVVDQGHRVAAAVDDAAAGVKRVVDAAADAVIPDGLRW